MEMRWCQRVCVCLLNNTCLKRSIWIARSSRQASETRPPTQPWHWDEVCLHMGEASGEALRRGASQPWWMNGKGKTMRKTTLSSRQHILSESLYGWSSLLKGSTKSPSIWSPEQSQKVRSRVARSQNQRRQRTGWVTAHMYRNITQAAAARSTLQWQTATSERKPAKLFPYKQESWTLKQPVHPSTCWIWESFTEGRELIKENAVVGGGSGAVQCWGLQQSSG